MSKRRKISDAIKKYLRDNSWLWVEYSNWYVGVTNDIDRRRTRHESDRGRALPKFKYWRASSAREAADIEKSFLDKGMKGSHGGWAGNSIYIYIYKIEGPGS